MEIKTGLREDHWKTRESKSLRFEEIWKQLIHVRCNSSRSNSSCRERRRVVLADVRGRWYTWNTPRGKPAPWRCSRCHRRPRCLRSGRSDLKVGMETDKKKVIKMNFPLKLFLDLLLWCATSNNWYQNSPQQAGGSYHTPASWWADPALPQAWALLPPAGGKRTHESHKVYLIFQNTWTTNQFVFVVWKK